MSILSMIQKLVGSHAKNDQSRTPQASVERLAGRFGSAKGTAKKSDHPPGGSKKKSKGGAARPRPHQAAPRRGRHRGLV